MSATRSSEDGTFWLESRRRQNARVSSVDLVADIRSGTLIRDAPFRWRSGGCRRPDRARTAPFGSRAGGGKTRGCPRSIWSPTSDLERSSVTHLSAGGQGDVADQIERGRPLLAREPAAAKREDVLGRSGRRH